MLRREERPYEPPPAAEAALGPWLALLHDLGVAPSAALEVLGKARVAVFGLEAHGAHLAATLARSGVGALVLADPYPCAAGHLALLPGAGAGSVGRPLQDVVGDIVRAQAGSTVVETAGPELTREAVATAAEGCHILVGSLDKGSRPPSTGSTGPLWSAEYLRLYAESRGHAARIGPLVLPGRTACYMCYRMRGLACEDDFTRAMAYEEFLDQRRRPALFESGTAPALPPMVGAVLAQEVARASCPSAPPRSPAR